MGDDVILRVSKDDALTDLLISAGLGERVRYDHSLGHWLIWNGVRWEPDRKTRIYEEVRLTAGDLYKHAETAGPQGTPDGELLKMILPLFDISKKLSVLKTLASRDGIAVTADEFDKDPYLLGFLNGVLDLRTRTFDEHPPSTTLITKSTNIAWNPDATCPTFDAFIESVMGGDEEMVGYLMTMLGYSLFGLQIEQKFWLWIGRGANGKGVLARTMLRTLGDYGSAPDQALYMKTGRGAAHAASARPEIVKLLGLRFTAMSEPPGRQFDEQLLKAHTGEDVIIARDLYRGADQMLSFAPTHKIVFLANEPPKTEDVGISMRRRVRLVYFEQDYSGTRGDKHIEEALGKEVEGIAQRLASFAVVWNEKGLTEPAKVAKWSSEYIADNDPLSPFVDACIIETEGAQVAAQPMWQAYAEWSLKQGGDADEPVGRSRFGGMMAARFKRIDGRAGRFYEGIRLRTALDAA